MDSVDPLKIPAGAYSYFMENAGSPDRLSSFG